MDSAAPAAGHGCDGIQDLLPAGAFGVTTSSSSVLLSQSLVVHVYYMTEVDKI
jgi:hypothetical protein